jgi:tetratricopeptide (TPR) repeat protein
VKSLAVLVALGGVAHAQSTRYPPPADDLDAERDGYSKFWEDALEPGLAQYDDLIARARKLVEQADTRADGEDLLAQATQLLPDRADAWAWLGLAREEEGDFARCRTALDRAWAIDPTWDGGKRELGVALGVCRSRAGDVDGADEVLERLVARGTDDVETLWRLGEVEMAQGRLDDARAALTLALAETPADRSYVHAAWALAVAADRARDPEASHKAAETALRLDNERVRVVDVPGGFLPPSDAPYYAAIAADVAELPEIALLQIRRFRALVPDGPWAERAAEHEEAWRTFALADRLIVMGSEPGDARAIKKQVAKVEPGLRACLQATPVLLLELTITAVDPAPVAATLAHPTYGVQLPKAGVSVTFVDGDAGKDATDAAAACVAKAATGIVIPRPTVAGTWTSAVLPVIAP